MRVKTNDSSLSLELVLSTKIYIIKYIYKTNAQLNPQLLAY